jgi:hypothetical protein
MDVPGSEAVEAMYKEYSFYKAAFTTYSNALKSIAAGAQMPQLEALGALQVHEKDKPQ